MKNILVTIPILEEQRIELEATVKGGKHECRFYYAQRNRNLPSSFFEKEVAKNSENIPNDIHVVLGDMRPEELKPFYNTLEVLNIASAGYDGYTGLDVLRKECHLCNVVGAYHDIVSEQMLALTFAVCRNMGATWKSQEEHKWQHPGPMKAISESVCVVVGLGDIGSAYARKMKALGATVIGVRKSNREKPDCLDEQYTVDHLDEVLPHADILALVAPSNHETDYLINEKRMLTMKEDCVIVNVGRGNILDEKALIKQLGQGKFKGVGLDVMSVEPLPADNPLWDAPRVIITPHTGGAWQPRTQREIFEILKDNLYRWDRGEKLTHEADRGLN